MCYPAGFDQIVMGLPSTPMCVPSVATASSGAFARDADTGESKSDIITASLNAVAADGEHQSLEYHRTRGAIPKRRVTVDQPVNPRYNDSRKYS